MERRHLVADLGPLPEPGVGLPVRHPSAGDAEALAVLMLDAYTGTIDFEEGDTLDVARDEVSGYLSGAPLLEHSFLVAKLSLPGSGPHPTAMPAGTTAPAARGP